MEQRVSIIALGVSDLSQSRAFYERLGWRGQEVEQTVFFQAGGIAVILWGRAKLSNDAGIVDNNPGDGFGGITLAHNVRTPSDVDQLLATAEAAGATITHRAESTFYGGYAGYFADPDGHLWEVSHNPGFALGPDGALTLPNFGGA